MIRVLLLSCGTNACSHVAKVLKQKFSDYFYIVGCDINKEWLVPTSKYLDDFVQCPVSIDDGYYSFILELCKTKGIDWILPSFDNEHFLFCCDNEDLKLLGVKSFGINSTLEFYRDKQKTNEFFASVGIPVPKKFSIDMIDYQTEYFIKPIHGVGSVGTYKKLGKDIKILNSNNDFLIQEICFEPEYTLECFLYNKKIYSVTRERIMSKSGVCTKTRVFKNKTLENYAYKLASMTNLPYIFNMQFMKNMDNQFVCTDLNLRTAGGMSLSFAAGFDEVSAIANIMLGKDEATIIKSVNSPIQEQYVVRSYQDIVTKKIKNKIAFDLDGTLLDSKNRHKMVMLDVLQSYGIDIDVSDLIEYKIHGQNNLSWLASKEIDDKTAEKIHADWIANIEDEKYLLSDILYPHVFDLLKKLSTENDLFLITARHNKALALKQINRLGLSQYLQPIVVSPQGEVSKLKALELVKHDISIYVGDTELDYKAAMIAKCNFYAVTSGFRSDSFMQNYTSNKFVTVQDAILAIMGGI